MLDLLSDKEDDWQTATIQQAIKKYKGADNFFQAVADFYQRPIMTAQGTSKQRTIKEEQRPYLEATSITIYGGNYLTDKQTSYSCIGFETTSHEVYQFVLSNNQYTRELIKRHQSSKIKELTLKEALTSIQTIAKEDTDAKETDRFIECDFPHMKINAWVKRRAYRVIENSQRNNRYQLPANTVYQRKEYIEQF